MESLKVVLWLLGPIFAFGALRVLAAFIGEQLQRIEDQLWVLFWIGVAVFAGALIIDGLRRNSVGGGLEIILGLGIGWLQVFLWWDVRQDEKRRPPT